MLDHPFKSGTVSVIMHAYDVDLFSRFPGISQAVSKFNLDSDMSVTALLQQAGHSSGVDEALFHSRNEQLNAYLLLESILQRPFKTLSRGERQRVKLACDLMSRSNESRLFLIEEP